MEQQPKSRQWDWPLCQSCARPLVRPEHYGLNVDGTKNSDYCCSCFHNGSFTEPGLTLEQMIEKVAEDMITKVNMPRSSAEILARAFITPLKRWNERSDSLPSNERK